MLGLYILLSRTRPAGPGKHSRKPVDRHGAIFFRLIMHSDMTQYIITISAVVANHRTWQVDRLDAKLMVTIIYLYITRITKIHV